jgi:uncharacterized protein (DUF1778 family)
MQALATSPRRVAPLADRRLEARVTSEVLDTAKRAAALQGQTLTDFVVFSVSTAAQKVLLDQLFFSVDEEKFNAFEAALAAPLNSNAAIMKLLSSRSPWEN